MGQVHIAGLDQTPTSATRTPGRAVTALNSAIVAPLPAETCEPRNGFAPQKARNSDVTGP